VETVAETEAAVEGGHHFLQGQFEVECEVLPQRVQTLRIFAEHIPHFFLNPINFVFGKTKEGRVATGKRMKLEILEIGTGTSDVWFRCANVAGGDKGKVPAGGDFNSEGAERIVHVKCSAKGFISQGI
jgi:hypothetical protein